MKKPTNINQLQQYNDEALQRKICVKMLKVDIFTKWYKINEHSYSSFMITIMPL
jgi:hypothetical protein